MSRAGSVQWQLVRHETLEDGNKAVSSIPLPGDPRPVMRGALRSLLRIHLANGGGLGRTSRQLLEAIEAYGEPV